MGRSIRFSHAITKPADKESGFFFRGVPVQTCRMATVHSRGVSVMIFSRTQGLQFQPELGHVLMCDFETGFRPPEMIKRRPVIVISPKLRIRRPLCTVVPLSTKRPDPVEAFHHKLPDGTIPGLKSTKETWVKCDMIYAVSLERLDRLKTGHRKYSAPRLPRDQILKIQKCLLHALGMHTLTNHIEL